MEKAEFSDCAPAANPVFIGHIAVKKADGTRESFAEVTQRVVDGLSELGRFNKDEERLVRELLQEKENAAVRTLAMDRRY